MGIIQDTDWYKERPPLVQQVIDQHPPDRLYRLKTTGQIVFLFSYEEGEDAACTTCTVNISQRYNSFLLEDRRVFGVLLADLEEVDNAWSAIVQDAFTEADLPHIFISVQDATGKWGACSTADASDEQFNTGIIGAWKGAPWTVRDRVAFLK